MKHNVVKLPVSVRGKLHGFGNNQIVAACTQQFKLCDVKNGALLRYGITIPDAGVIAGLKGIFEPAPNAGRFSLKNCRNTVIIHKDEPKIPVELDGVATDWHGRQHPFTYIRACYRRSIVSPKHIKIAAEIIRVELDSVVVAFRVGESLRSSSPDFQSRLLAGLNLLQENVGACDIERADTNMSQYQHLIRANWRIFPPGTLTNMELACRVYGRLARQLDNKQIMEIQSRYDFLTSLGAKEIIVGMDSFNGYIGARFDDDIVVFDNVRLGNAVYILREDWETLSKKTKRELLQMNGVAYRIPHLQGWKHKVFLRLAALRIKSSMLKSRTENEGNLK